MATGKRWKILVTGQTPPPWHGQAVMIQTLMAGDFAHADLTLLRMDLSRSADSIGRFAWGKVWRLFRLIVQTWWLRVRYGLEVLYYPPAGRERWALMRDVCYLLLVRWLFKRTVYHFHAAGFEDNLRALPALPRRLALWAYGRPDAVVRVAAGAADPAGLLRARRSWVVRNGVDVPALKPDNPADPTERSPTLLFMGRLCEAKGVEVLIRACARLKARRFRLVLAGDWESAAYEEQVRALLVSLGLGEMVDLPGALSGESKWRALTGADLFCLPTHYPDEVLPVAVIEAMAMGLPVVATQWGCLAELVHDRDTGLLVPPRDEEAVAAALITMLDDPGLRSRMGGQARARYAEGLTADAYRAGLDEVFSQL